MESTAVRQPPDYSLLVNGQQTMYHISKEGRMFYPCDLSAATKAGYLKPILVAGRKLYYLPDVEAFAKKWAERVVNRKEATQ